MESSTARNCEQCGAGFVAVKKWARFCSNKCRLEAHKEKENDEAVRKYLSKVGRLGGIAKTRKHPDSRCRTCGRYMRRTPTGWKCSGEGAPDHA